MAKYLLLALVAVSPVLSKAQYFLGLRGSPYGGVTNVEYNPAIAGSNTIVDVNLIGLAANINNNYVGMDRKVIYHPSLFNDPNFQDKYLRERVNGKNKNAYAGAEIQGPLSFMLSFGPKKNRSLNAIAFTYHTNFVFNADGVSEILARSAYYGFGNRANQVTQFLGQRLQNSNLATRAAAWNDFGLTYSRLVIDKGVSRLKVGGTLKLIMPIAGAYGYARNINYQFTELGFLTINNSSVNYATSQGLITSQGNSPGEVRQSLNTYTRDAFTYKNAQPTFAADFGAVYEWRPDNSKTNVPMDCQCSPMRDEKRYKAAIGFSVMDIGAMRFKRGPYSENFYADIDNWYVGDAQFPNGVQSFEDTLRARFQQQAGGKYFTIWLPTRFNLYLDYNIMKDFGVTFSTTVAPNMAPNRRMVHHVTTFAVTPKYENKWFGVYVPLSYDVMNNVSLGATVRVGPLIIGTQDLLGLFAKKYVHNADVHAALKITIPEHKRCNPKKDMRFSGQL